MADTRINALATTAAATAADDFVVIDGTTNGTRKHSAYTPVFSTVTASGSMSITGATGSLTLGAATETLTIAVSAAGAGTITPKSGQTLTIAGTLSTSKKLTVSFASATDEAFTVTNTTSGKQWVFGPGTASYGFALRNSTDAVNAIGISDAGVVTVPATTASTTSSTGALVVGNGTSGGLGVGGRITLGDHTTSAGGIGIGSDVSLYRAGVGQLDASLSQFTFRATGAASTPNLLRLINDRDTLNDEWALSFATSNYYRGRIACKTTDAGNGAGSVLFYTGTTGGTPALALTLDSSQNATFAGSVTTSAPTGGAGAWELGVANAVSPTSPNRTLTVEIGGTVYYIHAKTTND